MNWSNNQNVPKYKLEFALECFMCYKILIKECDS